VIKSNDQISATPYQGESPYQGEKSSRLPGFYEQPISERLRLAGSFANLSQEQQQALGEFGALNSSLTDTFIENGIGTFALPLGVATNFVINNQDILIPMAVEETSVLAAASHGAKLARSLGGFQTQSSAPVMIGQVQLYVSKDFDFEAVLREHKNELLAQLNQGHERLEARGGGAKDLQWRYIDEIKSLVIHILIDTRDAMGANIVNTMAEKLSGLLPKFIPCQIGLRILSNLCDRRLSRAHCRVSPEALTTPEFDGAEIVAGIVKAYEFAFYDPYRAATHNKGVMNGIDPVVIATGNDWRAVEAGAHAYCCKNGHYGPMTRWWQNSKGELEGELEIPMAVGVVGGVTKLHPSAKASLQLMGNPGARFLSEIICAVGLAQNLSALRALSSEGIQKGHMNLHIKNTDLLRHQGATKL
jgi:hydroxymethylglutaryl-CoA reductase